MYGYCLVRGELSCDQNQNIFPFLFVAFVEDNVTMRLIGYFENRVSYFVQNRRK